MFAYRISIRKPLFEYLCLISSYRKIELLKQQKKPSKLGFFLLHCKAVLRTAKFNRQNFIGNTAFRNINGDFFALLMSKQGAADRRTDRNGA